MRPIFFPVLLLVALLGARLLGVRLGWWRALLVAWLGLATAGILITTLTGESTPPLALVIGIGLLAMMAWAGIFELLSRGRPGPERASISNPLTVVQGWLLRGRRRLELATIIARFGLARFGRPRAAAPRGSSTGRAMRLALERAGGIFVKLGQFLSTRPDLVSPEIAEELKRLQQKVEPVPSEDTIRVFQQEFGAEPSRHFAAFDPEPVAAASLAQVHRAILPDSTPVAVKIQRPNVGQRVRTDLDILQRIASRLERRTEWARELRLSEVVEAFADNVLGELDFRTEARNLAVVSDAVRRHRRFVVPRPTPELTRSRVLVMEWIEGSRLTDVTSSLDGDDQRELARGLLRCFLDQVLVVGTFHADPHPGNLFLTKDGRVALLDCGSIGRLDRRQTRALQEIVLAIDAQDAAQLRDAFREITSPARTVDDLMLERALGDVLSQHLGPGATVGSALFTSLMDVMRGFGLAVDPAVGGALRALATLQSTCELLAPDLDLIAEAKSYGRTLLRAQLVSTTERSARDELEAALFRLGPMLLNLPRRLERIMAAVERNEMAVGIHLLRDEADRRSVEQVAAPFVTTIASASTGLIGGLLLLAADSSLTTTTDRLLQALGIGCVTVALLTLLRVLVATLRRLRSRDDR